MQAWIDALGAPTAKERLAALDKLKQAGGVRVRRDADNAMQVNNHIHTTYSFSPYSPTKAVYMAAKAELQTAGIMDHDSVSGAAEFMRAGACIGMATTVGVECRVSLAGTPFADKKVNNPDQAGIVYLALHGIPHGALDRVDAFFAPLRARRNARNRAMVGRINEAFGALGVSIDFEKDVVPLSMAYEGGSITERHISLALALKLMDAAGRGAALVQRLEEQLQVSVGAAVRERLMDKENPYYEFDLLGLIKSDIIALFYIDATDECPPMRDFLALAHETGAIAVYPYLGDVGVSVTQDKRTQKFEDDFLDALFAELIAPHFDAVAYMPSRNTCEQLLRLRTLCERYRLLQISGEDINSPRQSFICAQLQDPLFHNLVETTWALIGHEKLASEDKAKGITGEEAKQRFPDMAARIAYYAAKGRA